MKAAVTRYRYEVIAAVAGAIVMILELVGARMVAPYFGTSLYVWTAMIGVILGALSFGYWYGGRIADRQPSDEKLMRIIVLAAAAILATLTVQETVLALLARVFTDARIGALFAAVVLFAPPALLLGIVSPYVARLRLDSLRNAGQSIGRLYAAGTFGSILGTFLAGYWLIAWFGNRTLAVGLILALIGLSVFTAHTGWRWFRAALVALSFGLLAAGGMVWPNVIADIDTPYSRYMVTESDGETPLRALLTDPFTTQSAQYVGRPDILVLPYAERFGAAVEALHPQRIAVIGGGVYTFPVAMAQADPELAVDVVEIDPALTDIAREYFGLTDRPNLQIIHQDGRVFLNQASRSYDIVFMDAFSSLTPPYQLMTQEAIAHQARLVPNKGVVVANVIAKGVSNEYLGAVLATYRQSFSSVEVYQVSRDRPVEEQQNLMVVATNHQPRQIAVEQRFGVKPLLIELQNPLTDDYAPLEQLINGS